MDGCACCVDGRVLRVVVIYTMHAIIHILSKDTIKLMLPVFLLQMAYKNQWEDVFKCISAIGCNVNDTFPSSKTLLHVAAIQGNVAAARRLLQMGANSLARDDTGWLAIHYAAWFGLPNFCAALPTTCIAEPTTLGWTTLTLACYAKGPEKVEKKDERCRLICWLLEQPECEYDVHAYTAWRFHVRDCYSFEDIGNLSVFRVEAAFEWARGGRQRWTPARVAWIAACCV